MTKPKRKPPPKPPSDDDRRAIEIIYSMLAALIGEKLQRSASIDGLAAIAVAAIRNEKK
jgi:hypothetical protein